MANGSNWQTAANSFMGAPLMNMGLSLLAAGSDDRINPWAAAQQGLNTGMQQLQAQDMMDMRRQDMNLRQQAADRQTAAQDAVYDLFGYDPESGQLTPSPSRGPQYANASLATAGTIPGVSGGSGTLAGPLQAVTQTGTPQMNPLLASLGITPEQAPAMARVMGSNPQMLQSLLMKRLEKPEQSALHSRAVAGGLIPDTPEYQAFMLRGGPEEAPKAPATGMIQDPNDPSNWIYDPDYLAGQEQLKRAGATNVTQSVGGDQKPSVFEEALDKDFAPVYTEWTLQGGYADAANNLNTILGAIDELEKDGSLSGGIINRLPDWMRATISPEGLNLQQSVEQVVQRNLRQVLGAQFAEKEGDRLISRAYNPALDPKYNIARLKALSTTMQRGLEANEAAARYVERHGTLQGYRGPQLVKAGDFYTAMDAAEKAVDDNGGGGDGGGFGRFEGMGPAELMQEDTSAMSADELRAYLRATRANQDAM